MKEWHQEFIKSVERLRRSSKEPLTLMDALICYAEEEGLEIEALGDMVSKTPIIKSRLQEESENLLLLPKTSRLDL